MLFEAGLISFFRTLVIIAVVYYAIKFLIRFLFPFILNRFLKKQQQKYGNSSETRSRKEGEVHVKSNPHHKSSTDKLGDYVDYEEIKENE